MKITKKYRLLIRLFSFMLFFVFVAENGLHGQEIVITPASQLSEVDEDNETVIIRNEKKYPTHINFVSKASGDVCASFDIRANSPYHHFDYPLDTNNLQSYVEIVYNLSKVDKQEIESQIKGLEFANHPTLKRIGYHNLIATYSIETNKKENPNYIGIAYHAAYYDRLGGPIGQARHSKLIVLNNKGEIIFRKNKINNETSPPIVTPDGNYVAFRYGGLMGHSDWQAPEGIEIYDLKTGKLVAKKEINGCNNPRVLDNNILCSAYIGNKSYKYCLFDLFDNKVYCKIYPVGSFVKSLEAKESDGFLFKDGHKDYYAKDFDSEPILSPNKK